MIPGAHLLTAPTSLANYKPEDLTSTARSLISSSFIFLQVDRDLTEREPMAQPPPIRPRSRTNDDTELWFNMPSSARGAHEQSAELDQSAYQATSNRRSANRTPSPNRFPSIPVISTSAAINKPLPPSPVSEKKKRKPASLRNLIRRRPSGGLDPSHLQPEPNQHHQRSASANLSPDPYQYYYQQQSSRSMPTSPLEYTQTSPPAVLARAHSAAAHYAESSQYQAYSVHPQQQEQHQQVQRSASISMDISSFEPSAPRARRTFPEAGSPPPRDSISERPRPHTWLSPTDPIGDSSEFRLFVEATSGLPDSFDPMSPDSGPRLQSSLFGRSRQNDRIPIPLQDPSESDIPHPAGGWQNISYGYGSSQQSTRSYNLSSSALPRTESYQQPQIPPNLNAINLELERLGLADAEDAPDDELPNYAQSQAEMSEKKRREAAARARELETRWNNSRGWRNR